MKKTIILTFLITFVLPLSLPFTAHADVAYRASLLERISYLLQVIEQLTSDQSANVVDSSLRASSYETELYNGSYDDMFYVRDGVLVAPRGQRISGKDAQYWDVVRSVIGDGKTRDFTIDEFRLFDDPSTPFDSFVELRPGEDRWILAVNTGVFEPLDADAKRDLRDLTIHEYLHVLLHYKSNMEEDFADTFWSRGDYKNTDNLEGQAWARANRARTLYYEDNQSRFVSDYATINIEEDMAESFMYFVLDARPGGNTVREQKIKFFYDYRDMREIRNDIRQRTGL